MSTEQIEQLIVQGIRSFDGDPADSDFQRGYLAALVELAEAAGIELPKPATH